MTYSANPKLNKVLNEIEAQIMEMCDTQEESREQMLRYMRFYPKEPDYNLAAYGNLLIYYYDVRKMYEKCGYKTMSKKSNNFIWATYRRQVGYVAREINKIASRPF